MNTKTEFKNRLCGQFKNLLAVRTSVPLLCFVALGLTLSMPARAETPPTPIPFSDIGAKATADYHGDALGITATSDGARLRCGFQKLEGHATAEGLWLESTDAGRRRKTPSHCLRHLPCVADLSTLNPQPSTVLPATGTVSVEDKLVRFTRPGVDGGILRERGWCAAGLRHCRAAGGRGGFARGTGAERGAGRGDGFGARLKLDGSGRMLAYSRLRAEDATGRELTARLEVLSADRLAVSVADANATYPCALIPPSAMPTGSAWARGWTVYALVRWR